MVCVQGEASSETPMSRRGSPEGEGSGAARLQMGSSSMRRHKKKSKPWASPSHPEQVPAI